MFNTQVEGEARTANREMFLKLPNKGAVVRALAVAALAASSLACGISGGGRQGGSGEFWEQAGYGSMTACKERYAAVALYGSADEYCKTGDNGYGN